MLKRTLLLSLSLSGGSALAHAQATATASRAGDAQIGGGYVSAVSDYGTRFTGYMAYGDFDFTQHIGVEVNYHYASAPSPSPLYEKTYQVGGRYFRTYGRLMPYARVSVGRGVFNYPACAGQPANSSCANLAFNMFSIAGGTDIRVRPWLYLRADFEYQKWPSFQGQISNGQAAGPSNGLTPELFSFGAAYHFPK